jgi:hypothetical protein
MGGFSFCEISMVEKVVPRMGLLCLAIVERRRDQKRHGYSRVLDQHGIRYFGDDGVSVSELISKLISPYKSQL